MSTPADFQGAEENYQNAVATARDAGVSEDQIQSLSRRTSDVFVQEHGSPKQTEVPVTEITQDVPVGDDLTADFASMSESEEPEVTPVEQAFMRTTEVTNPFVKSVVGASVNDPVIYNNKVNTLASYDMKMNGSDIKTARAKAESSLARNDFDTAMQEYKNQMAGVIEADWTEYLQTADPEEIVSYAEFKREHSLVEAYEGKLGNEKLFADTFSGLTVDQEQEANNIVQGYANRLLQDKVDTVDAMGWGASALGLFIPDYVKDINDLVESDVFDSKESYFNFIEGFKASTPDQKARILDLYVPKVWDAFDGNPMKATGAVNILFDERHETSFWIDASFDAVDISGFGFDIFKLGAGGMAAVKLLRGAKASKKTSALANIKMKYRDAKNPSASAEVTAASKSDETGDIQKGNNQTQADEATDVSAANTENTTVSNNSVDGVADAHTRLFEQIKYNREPTPFQANFLSQLDRTRMEGLKRGHEALKRRHASNITTLKHKLVKEPQATEKAARMQRDLAKEAVKLEKVTESLDDINNELRFGDIANRVADTGQAINRGEIPEEAEKFVRSTEEKLGSLYTVLSTNMAEAIDAGLDGKTAEAILTNIRSKTKVLADSLEDVMPEMLNAAEKAAVEKAAIEKIQNSAADAGRVISGIELINKDRRGFQAKITYEDGSSVENVRFTENDLGDLGVTRDDIHANMVQTWGSKVFSPEHQLDAATNTRRFGGLVRDATFGGDQASRIKRALNALGREVTSGLSRTKRNQLDRLILASDEASTETGRLFTIKELREGVDTAKGTEIIDPDVVDSYFKMHLFLGEVKRLMDHSVRRSLEIKGFKNLSFKDGDKLRQAIVKPVNNWGTWNPSPKDKIMVYDEASETWQNTVAADIVKAQDDLRDDHDLVEFFSKGTDSAGNVTTHALVPKNPKAAQVGELPGQVLNNTPGMYVPRVYKAGYYYVRDAGDARKNTVMAFERKTDADKYVKRKNEEGKRYQRFQDGDMGYEDSLIALAQGYGGLYTSARKRENLQMVAAGKDPEVDLGRPERLGGISSVQRYLDATGNMMPMAEQRITAVRRFENQLDDVARGMGFERGLETPGDFNSKILLPDNSPEKALFENMRDFIKGSYGTMSDQEKTYQGLMMSIAEYMEKGFDIPVIGGFTESARKFAVDMAHADVRRKLLGATFDAHLGWFNGAQLYVQAQNAALAISMHPIDGAKAIPQAFAARTIILTSNEPTLGELSKIVTKDMGFSETEFRSTVRAFRQSGLYDSVMRVADYGGKAAGIGGTAMDGFRMGMKAGRTFYEEGELMSRLTSFFIAKENLKRKARTAGKKFDVNDPTNIRKLSDETYRIMMNMQKENAAWWQNNWLGIPLQFAQVQAKLIENILPTALGGSTRWTAKEKMSVLGGQLLMYGAVGVPLVEQTVNYMNGVLGVQPNELKEENPQALEFIQEGFTGVISNALGFENNFSDRGSIIKGLDQNALAALIKGVYNTTVYKDDEVNLSDYMGASLNTFYRTKEAADQVIDSARRIFYKPTGKVLTSELYNVSDAFGRITSTWSNAQKTKYMHGLGMYSGNGNLMIPEGEFDYNFISRTARAMGFPYDKETAFYNSFEAAQADDRDWSFIRRGLKQRMLEHMQNPGDQEVYQNDLDLIARPLTEIERDKMMHQIIEETLSGKNAYDKQMRTELRNYMSGAEQTTPIEVVE